MVIHSSKNANSGIDSKVLLGGANGMYIFTGTNLAPPNITTGDYQIQKLAGSIGCNSPLTMQWTDEGTIFLGMDKQVYIVPFDSLNPIPIGDKIRSTQANYSGIEAIPANQMPNASAVYHDGYYKLSVASSGSSYNDTQWWLDVRRLNKDQVGHYGPWFGPMIGMSFLPQIVLNGPGDNGQLYVGESFGTTGSYVYEGSASGVFSDNAAAMESIWHTFLNPLSNPNITKDVHVLEVEVLTTGATITVDFRDLIGSIKSSQLITLSSTGTLYGSVLYGAVNYSGTTPIRKRIPVDPPIHTRLLSLILKNSGTNKLEYYSLRAEEFEQGEGLG
jgi:hypothetical protein